MLNFFEYLESNNKANYSLLPSYVKHGCNFVYGVDGSCLVIQISENMSDSCVNEDNEMFNTTHNVTGTSAIFSTPNDIKVITHGVSSFDFDNFRETALADRIPVYSKEKAIRLLDNYMERNFSPNTFKDRMQELAYEGKSVNLICSSNMQGTVGELATLALIGKGVFSQNDVYEWEFSSPSAPSVPSFINSRKKQR